MSMLTPPGMGGKYRITGNRYPRMRPPRRRRRVVLSVLAVTTAVGVVGWGTWELVGVFTGGERSTQAEGRGTGACSSRAQVAEATPVRLPKPKDITVNVYNATTRTGLAKRTAEELEKRGFTIGEVDNAPPEFDKKVKATGLLLGSEESYRNHTLSVLGTQVKGAETRTDDRKGEAVDLVLGDGFRKLTPEENATQALAALASPRPSPTPSC